MTPYLALARSAPAPSSPLRAGEANVRIDSPELHRRPRTGSCEQQPAIKRKRMATSTSSRSADQAARAGRSASQLPGIGAPRARVRAANVVNAAKPPPQSANPESEIPTA